MEKYCEQVATRSFLPSPPRRVKSFPRFPRSTCSFVATKNARPGFLIRHRRLSVFFFFTIHPLFFPFSLIRRDGSRYRSVFHESKMERMKKKKIE